MNINKNIYVIPMFPYPSGYFHIGHARNYIFSDILSRYLKLTTKQNIIHALGVDAFGLPAENAAIKYNINPRDWTDKNAKHIIKSLKQLEISFSDDKWIDTTSNNYIKLNQFIFQILLENNYIYRKQSYQNWDPHDKTVLSHEQIINGKGWRSGVAVEKILINSWFVKISEFAYELKDELKTLSQWSDHSKKIQNHWMSHTNGYNIKFQINNSDQYIVCFTKNPKYISQAKFLVLAYTHDIAIQYMNKHELKIDFQNIQDICIKTDVQVINPYNNEILSVYIGGYVLTNFGTQALYAAPEYDERDYQFASNFYKYNPKFQQVIKYDISVLDKLMQKNIIYKHQAINLHDWCISRQRVWGCPIPTFICNDGHITTIISTKINDIKLKCKTYEELSKTKIQIECSVCGKLAISEIDTLDTFVDSSWYYLCYINKNNIPNLNNKYEAIEYLSQSLENLPIDYYIGGIEHANLHLIYTRAMIKILFKCLNLPYKAPILRLINQGAILHKSYKDNNNNYVPIKDIKNIKHLTVKVEKMSKSKLNTIEIDDVLKDFNVDVIRLALMSNMNIDVSFEWENNILYKKQKFILQIKNMINNIDTTQLNTYKVDNIYYFSIYVENDIFVLVQKYHKNMNELKIHNVISTLHEIYNLSKKQDKNMHILSTVILLLSTPIAIQTCGNFYKEKLNIDNINSVYYEIKRL